MTLTPLSEASRSDLERKIGQILGQDTLSAGVLLPEVEVEDDEDAAIRERYKRWARDYGPATPYQCWLVEQMAVASVRVERCQRHERSLRGSLARRAKVCWEEDRRLDAEQLGQGLSRRPALVARKLEETLQGCAWLIERWEALGRIAEANGAWSDAQQALALDMLGTPAELREDPSRLEDNLGALARREVDRLAERQQSLILLDGFDQMQAALGKVLPPTPALNRVRQYESQCVRQLRWATAQFYRVTLGVGLSSPTLGAPPAMTAAVLGSPVAPAEERRPEPDPVSEPEFEPIDAEAPTPEPVTRPRELFTFQAPTMTSAISRGVSTAPQSRPSGNRRSRRAAQARARRVAVS
jgi:hypothetical protein